MDDLMQDYVIAMRDAFFKYAERCDDLTSSSIKVVRPNAIAQMEVNIQKSNAVYIALCELIQWIINVFEKIDIECFEEQEKNLLLGFKYINNIVKHERKKLKVEDVMTTNLAYMLTKESEEDYYIDFRILTKWRAITAMKPDSRSNSYRKSYEEHSILLVKKPGIL